MTTWSNSPPPDGKLPGIRILRAPASTTLRFTSFSRHVTGAMTHYSGNRSKLCIGPNCPDCELHNEPRWYGYLATFDPRTYARRIFEFPRGPYNEIRDYLAVHPDLFGARIATYRKPQRANGPVQLDLTAPDPDIKKYPDEVDVFRLLCQMWKLKHIDQLENYNRANLHDAPGIQDPLEPPTNPHPPTNSKHIHLFPLKSPPDPTHHVPPIRNNGPN